MKNLTFRRVCVVCALVISACFVVTEYLRALGERYEAGRMQNYGILLYDKWTKRVFVVNEKDGFGYLSWDDAENVKEKMRGRH